jgi:hypothetical protein
MSKKVMFATPSYDRTVCVEYVMSMMQTVVDLQAMGIENTLMIVGGDCFVDRARNMLCHEFLKSDATDLFFIDADLGWDVAGVHSLLSREEEIVAGVYRKREDFEVYPVRFDRPSPIRDDGLVECDGAPTGFMRIKRSALEALEGRVPVYMQDGKRINSFFWSGIQYEIKTDETQFWGEDFLFSKAWRQLGKPIFIDPNINFMHVGRKQWRGNYLEFQKQLDAGSAAA